MLKCVAFMGTENSTDIQPVGLTVSAHGIETPVFNLICDRYILAAESVDNKLAQTGYIYIYILHDV